MSSKPQLKLLTGLFVWFYKAERVKQPVLEVRKWSGQHSKDWGLYRHNHWIFNTLDIPITYESLIWYMVLKRHNGFSFMNRVAPCFGWNFMHPRQMYLYLFLIKLKFTHTRTCMRGRAHTHIHTYVYNILYIYPHPRGWH
jgi:hypothetical protein